MIQSIRTKRKRKDSDDDTCSNDQDVDVPEVNIRILSILFIINFTKGRLPLRCSASVTGRLSPEVYKEKKFHGRLLRMRKRVG